MSKIILFIGLTYSVTTLAQTFHARIINGTKLNSSQLAVMGKLSWSNGDTEQICSATLIGPKTIVTAAHCVKSSSFGMLTSQTFGPIGGKTYSVKLQIHPSYRRALNYPGSFSLTNDIAIGILNKEVTNVTPATVTNQIPVKGAKILFAGTGQPSFNRALGYSQVITVGNLGLTQRALSTGKPQAADHGDSGGPNFMIDASNRIYLIGVNSTSTGTKDMTDELGWDILKPYTQGTALIWPVTSSGTKTYLQQFVANNGVQVCGINKTCPTLSKP
jgi:secreted trypsin-like serine protease